MKLHKAARWALVTGAAAVLAAGVLAAPAQASPAGPQAAPAGPQGAPAAPAATAAAKPGLATSDAMAAPDAALSARQNAMMPAAQALSAQARNASSDISGVKIDPATGVIDLYRTNPAQSLGIAGLPAGVKLAVHQSKFTRTAMNQAASQVMQDAQALGQQKVGVTSVGPTVDGSGIAVTVLASDANQLADATSVLRKQYGSIIGTVRSVSRQPSQNDLYFAGWRFNDFAPWYGGDRIASSVGGCSTGFAANYNGGPVMLTASHCGGTGTAFYNGPTTGGGFNLMGSSVYSDTATDVGAISVSSYSLYVNVGAAENSTQLYVGSWASPVVGEYLCQSGSYTGEVCALQVVDTGQYNCLSWFLWWCTSSQGPLADVINYYGSASYSAGHGDSGGPVYLRSGSSGTAVGLVHGVLTGNAASAYPAYTPDTLWCPAPEGWSQRCSSGFSFAHMPGF
jgi:hypothetical protein